MVVYSVVMPMVKPYRFQEIVVMEKLLNLDQVIAEMQRQLVIFLKMVHLLLLTTLVNQIEE